MLVFFFNILITTDQLFKKYVLFSQVSLLIEVFCLFDKPLSSKVKGRFLRPGNIFCKVVGMTEPCSLE